MKVRLFYLFWCFLLISMVGKAAVVITGQLPGNIHSVVTFYGYADNISKAPVEIAKAHTDGAGNFRVAIPGSSGVSLKIMVENRSLSFYILPGGEYLIRDANQQLAVEDVAGTPVNRHLAGIAATLRESWFPLFISDTDPQLQLKAPVDSILRRLAAIEEKYAPDTMQPDYPLVHYKMASARLTLIHWLPDAAVRMNEFETDYFNRVPIQEKNPFYTELLENYMQLRMIMIPCHRYKAATYDAVDQLIHEAAYFPSVRLKQLALVAGLNQEYFMDREVEERTILNHRVQAEILHRITDPAISDMLQQVVVENNRARVGNKFPLLSLKNEKNETVSFADIQSDLILVDFWATWCWGCVEGMKSFPAWLQQGGKKLTIVAISIDDNPEKMKAFLDKREQLPGVLSLYNGRTGGYLDKLQIRGYPTYILLNKNREIIAMPGYTSSVADYLKAAL